MVLAAGCSDLRAANEVESPPAVEPFAGSAATLEALGGEVSRALRLGDVPALERVRLSEVEHNRVVWPELPASAPEVNFPVDLAWTNIQTRNRSAVARILPWYRGEKLSYLAAECRGGTERFRTFLVLTDCWVLFGAERGSDTLQAQLFKDVIVRGGGHKIFRYYDDEPTPYAGRTVEPSEPTGDSR